MYLKHKKEDLAMNEAIALGDFAENYQFIMQDEIQNYHWSKTSCTLTSNCNLLNRQRRPFET